MIEKKSKPLEKVYVFLILAFFYIPILYVVLFSFNDSKSLTKFTGFSTQWYERMFANRTIMEAIGYTVLCAVIATVVSTIVGTITAIGLSKSKKILREAITQVNNLPMLNPDIVTAIGFMLLFTSLKIETGFTTMVLAHIAFCIPYVILSIMPKILKYLYRYYISEVNPRFGGGYPHAYECGVNHMKLILNNLQGEQNKVNIGNYDEEIYMMKYNEIAIKKGK